MSRNIMVKNNNNPIQVLKIFEDGVLGNIKSYGLPTANILVPLEERVVVFNNTNNVLSKINNPEKVNAVYLSKFLAAVAVGLFDAALNYLWDETISEIRKRVIQYDLQYFYDNATKNEEKRKKLKKEEDIVELDDSELIFGARDIGLISELGYKHLDFIRFMRNWASAAHPNQNQITGLQLISWLETCIKEVISLPLSNIVIEIKQLLSNIKTNEISESDSKKIASSFINLNQQQINNLSLGFLGIYIDSDTASQVRQNINYLLPHLWERLDGDTRQAVGIKYGKFIANGDKDKADKVKSFLGLVDGLTYLPEDIKIIEIETAMQNLLSVHESLNNFYNEPIFARQLYKIIGKDTNIPDKIKKIVVLGVIKVFLTNGNGVAHGANPYYTQIIKQFNQKESLVALISFTDEQIASRLQFSLCKTKFKELLSLVKGKLSAPALMELYKEIDEFPGDLDKMKNDSKIKRMIDNVSIILS